jgi:uncharacterized protein YfbU (UPF0304 family)
MQLTRAERWILSNQLRILEALYPGEAAYLRQHREAIENGYELHYSWAVEHIYGDENIMTSAECQEVINILDMFGAIKTAYDALEDKSEIEEWTARFDGFDGNNETKQMAYARYFCSLDGGRFTELDRGDDFNSHTPVLDAYRRMLIEWRNSEDRYHLSKDDLVRITSARFHPNA